MSSSLHVSRLSTKGIHDYEETHRPTSRINVGTVERYASTIAGSVLVLQGLRRGTFGGLSLAVLGGGLLYRGMTGHCSAYEALHLDTSDKQQSDEGQSIHQGHLTKQTVTINRPAAELYAFWHDVANAPEFMEQVVSVEKLGEKTSRWEAIGPFGKSFAWDSEIINDDPGRLIAWKTLPGADVPHAGTVRFDSSSGDRGTVVTLEVNYEPPVGIIGLTIAKLLGQSPETQARENLRHFKQLMEAGEIPTITGTILWPRKVSPPEIKSDTKRRGIA